MERSRNRYGVRDSHSFKVAGVARSWNCIFYETAHLYKNRLSLLNVLFSSVRLKIQVESRSADLKAPDELLDLNGFTQRSGERARRRGRGTGKRKNVTYRVLLSAKC